MIQNNVARRCWDEDAEMECDGIPYADLLDEPDAIDLHIQQEREDREDLWRKPGEVWRRALLEANGGPKQLWDAETFLLKRQAGDRR